MGWIKMRGELAADPDVIDIAARIGIDEFGVVGRLHAVWSWLDQHSDDGSNVRITAAFLDRLTACSGFAAAMRAVGWLDGRDGAIIFPGYTEHNGETAKARAVTQKRVGRHRGKSVTNVTPAPLPEERREEEKRTDPPTEPPPTPPPAAAPRGVSEGKDSSLIPTTEQSKRFAAIFHRRLETPWTLKEVAAYRRLGVVPAEDLAAVEAYYATNWPPRRDVNILRHDLITFLNNFQGEVDRAHAAKAKPSKQNGHKHEWLPAKVVPMTPEPDAERIATEAKRQAEELKAKLRA